LYGCPHVQLDIGEERLIAVLDTGAEISLMPERIFEDLLAKGLRAPQLPVVNGALITAFGSRRSSPVTGSVWPSRFQEVKAPRFP